MTRVLAVADEESTLADGNSFLELTPDVIVACGDLPFDYLERLVTIVGKPLVHIPGNHDPEGSVPEGCVSVDGAIVDIGDLRVAGLGGSHRYCGGPNQYTQKQMKRRCKVLEWRARLRRRPGRPLFDLLVTHAAPLGVGDDDDPCHRGFQAFHPLVAVTGPKALVHGHVHPYGLEPPERHIGSTRVVNAVGYRFLEI